MIYQPEFDLSQVTIDKFIACQAKVFFADCRLRVQGKHVEFYVAAWQGDMYFSDLGRYENPEAEVKRIEALPMWQAAMRSFSAASMVRTAIAETPKFRG